jgi:hypothetical protein
MQKGVAQDDSRPSAGQKLDPLGASPQLQRAQLSPTLDVASLGYRRADIPSPPALPVAGPEWTVSP